jgi:hypothetical protein
VAPDINAKDYGVTLRPPEQSHLNDPRVSRTFIAGHRDFLRAVARSERFYGPKQLNARRRKRAETEGFEPSEPLRVLHLSRVVHSAGLCDVS